jgi:hypothetical protein
MVENIKPLVPVGLKGEELKAKILEYFDTHEWPTEDEIAKDLNANIIDVLDILHQLEKSGEIVSEPEAQAS